jgi:ElaB/YqjD/DUF883 family membrane-anchored ribosome-binding protein|tara:strand:- start:368 stop:2158 length:1791 start_codon:yes stop_codon:yes gene_type:complete
MAGKKASISMLIGGDADGLRKATKQASKSLDKFATNSAKAAKKAGLAFGALAGGVAIAALKIGNTAVNLASDFEESMSKTEAVFGDAMKGIKKASKSAAKDVGMSSAEFLDAASGFGVFGKAAGLSGKDLSEFSANLVKTAADVGSFNNLDSAASLDKLMAGLRGSNEPLQSLGILINAAQVEARALEMGLGDLNGEVSEGNKILARQALIMEALGSQGAINDFAKTSDGLANSQKILGARLKDVGIVIGQQLLPLALRLADGVSLLIAKFEELAPKLQPVLDRVKALAIKLMPKLKEQFDRAVQAIKPVIAKIKEFIKANPTAVIAGIATVLGIVLGGALIATVAAIAGVVTSFGFLVVAIGAGVTALVHFWQNSEKFRDIVNGVFEAVKAVAIPVITGIMDTLENLKTVFKGITDFLKGVFKGDFDLAMDGIKGILSGAVRQIVIILRTVKDAFANFFSLDTVQAGISIAIDAIMRMFKAIPGRIKSFAGGMFTAILTEFAKVANGVIKTYNKIADVVPILPSAPLIGIPQAARSTVPSSAAVRERSSSLSGSTVPVINNNTYVMPNMDPESFEPLMREDNRNNGPIEANVGFY